MPPFFVPIAAFVLWVLIFLSFLPVLRLDLNTAEQFLAPQLFASILILFLTWALSGPVAAAVLSLLSAIFVLYLSLNMKEPAFFLQVIIYAVLFIFVVFYLYRLQKTNHTLQVSSEKVSEDIVLTHDYFEKREALEKSLEKKLARFSQLQKYSEELKGIRQLDEAGWKIVSQLKSLLPKAESCTLYILDRQHQNLSLLACHSTFDKSGEPREGSVFDQWVIKRSQGLLVSDARNDFRFSSWEPERGETPFLSICANPLMSEYKVLGVIRASAMAKEVFTNDDLRLLDIFSSLAAVILNNILLYERMRELAIHDSLTGLFVNRYFMERLSEEVQRAHFSKSVFSLLLIDIDFFKRFNDEYGHAAGDVVLKHIAGCVQRCVEGVDLAARYGGEEFAVLLPTKSAKEALKIAEQIRVVVEKSRFALRRVQGKVTVSIGVATFPKDGRTREEMIWAADKNLYSAKKKGRNQVCG